MRSRCEHSGHGHSDWSHGREVRLLHKRGRLRNRPSCLLAEMRSLLFDIITFHKYHKM